jgi:hypothetical protein
MYKSGYSYFFIQKLAIEKILKICGLHFPLMYLFPPKKSSNLKKVNEYLTFSRFILEPNTLNKDKIKIH